MKNPSSRKPSNAQRLVLENLAAGRPATLHLHGRSQHGGYTGTRASLHARGWIDREGITPAGLAAIGKEPQEEGGLSDSTYEMLRAAVNVAREYQTRDVPALRSRLVSSYPGRETDIDCALMYWANDVARRHPDGRNLG